MYLFHITEIEALDNIIKDGYLKPPTEKDSRLGIGEGIYETNSFVFLSTTDKLFDKKINSEICLYFTSDLIYNKSFYLTTAYASDPIFALKNKPENTKKYPRNYKFYNKVLKDLYNFSVKKYPECFQSFNQVAIKNKVNIKKYLIGIDFMHQKPTPEMIISIKKYFPNIKINIKKILK